MKDFSPRGDESQKKCVSLRRQFKTTKKMEAKTTFKQRSREEIMAWLQQARDRKKAFQRRVNEEWEARQRSKKAAAESGYYDIEWV